jgi:hypothetical protein
MMISLSVCTALSDDDERKIPEDYFEMSEA